MVRSYDLSHSSVIKSLISGTGYQEGIGAEAQFNVITGLAQLTDKYIVADYNNFCMREIEPLAGNPEYSEQEWKTSAFAGQCGKSGDIDGRRQIARLNRPRDLVLRNNILFFTDTYNNKIKQIDLDKDLITTAHQSHSFSLYGFVLGTEKDEFYVTAPHGVLHINNQKETWLVGSATHTSTPSHGRFSGVGFYNPFSIQWLNKKVLIVTDNSGNTLKSIDLDLQQVQSLCTGGKSTIFRSSLKISQLAGKSGMHFEDLYLQ